MSNQRLSKLQKWILERIYKQKDIAWYCNHWLKDFYKLGDEKWSNSQRVVISKSLKNLMKKQLISKDRGIYDLTKKGVQALKANKRERQLPKVSFKDYQANKRKHLERIIGIDQSVLQNHEP